LHVKVESCGGGESVSDAVFEIPPKLAVTTAECVAVTALAFAVKPAVLEPAATLTDAGTVTAPSLLVRATDVAADALPLKVTVQDEVPGPVRDAGLQVIELRVGPGVAEITPAVPETATGLPPAEAAPGFDTPTVVLLRLADTVAEATATTPFWISFALTASATQL
jgi:hypothetical protein